MQCFQPFFSRIVNDSMSRKEAERKERQREVLTFFFCEETSTGGVTGDPHVDTFDGQHYLLLKQGSFSFWHFSGGLFAKRNGHLGIWARFPALAHASPVTMSEDLMLK